MIDILYNDKNARYFIKFFKLE